MRTAITINRGSKPGYTLTPKLRILFGLVQLSQDKWLPFEDTVYDRNLETAFWTHCNLSRFFQGHPYIKHITIG